jgi:hypothetical protein
VEEGRCIAKLRDDATKTKQECMDEVAQGHMDSFQSMLDVTTVVEASRVTVAPVASVIPSDSTRAGDNSAKVSENRVTINEHSQPEPERSRSSITNFLVHKGVLEGVEVDVSISGVLYRDW